VAFRLGDLGKNLVTRPLSKCEQPGHRTAPYMICYLQGVITVTAASMDRLRSYATKTKFPCRVGRLPSRAITRAATLYLAVDFYAEVSRGGGGQKLGLFSRHKAEAFTVFDWASTTSSVRSTPKRVTGYPGIGDRIGLEWVTGSNWKPRPDHPGIRIPGSLMRGNLQSIVIRWPINRYKAGSARRDQNLKSKL
jgi:hypothetical protein